MENNDIFDLMLDMFLRKKCQGRVPRWKSGMQLGVEIGVLSPFIGDPQGQLIGDPHIFMDDPKLFIRDPKLFIGDPKLFIGEHRFKF